MDEIKVLLENLVHNCLQARNEADDEMDEIDENDEDIASNEDVDKRKLIEQIGTILKGKVDDEVLHSIINEIAKASYKQDTDDEKAKNSLDILVNKLYSTADKEPKLNYISARRGIELGEQIYGA